MRSVWQQSEWFVLFLSHLWFHSGLNCAHKHGNFAVLKESFVKHDVTSKNVFVHMKQVKLMQYVCQACEWCCGAMKVHQNLWRSHRACVQNSCDINKHKKKKKRKVANMSVWARREKIATYKTTRRSLNRLDFAIVSEKLLTGMHRDTRDSRFDPSGTFEFLELV